MKEYNLKVLLVYPRYPDTFWSFKHALKFISKKAAHPPLGLLTVAAMLPNEWEKKLVDMNTTSLSDRDVKWADYVFMSAMAVQKDSAISVIKRCKKQGVKVVAGGPLFTTGYQEFDGVDHFVLNEAEITLPPFLEDLNNGCARHVYTSAEWPDIKTTPIPSWELVDMRKYSSMSVQYSRGCPFDCEFCDIIVLNGHVPRTKDKDQVLRELNVLYTRGWRSSVFIVDDNFIGNKRKLKTQILPAIIEWMKEKKHPFSLFTEASINLADDEELIRLMVEANFNMVFVGIETPNEESLAECGKFQNKNRDLMASVKKLQNHGLQVQGGFIIGFDNDKPSIFDKTIQFIEESGIIIAMVGLLNAINGTKLYKRLEKEKRLVSDFIGDTTDSTINFTPKMDKKILLKGYKKILEKIYSPKQFYTRVSRFIKEYNPPTTGRRSINLSYLKDIRTSVKNLIKIVIFLGILDKGRIYFWKLFFWSAFRRPSLFPLTITSWVKGYHIRKVFRI